METQGGFQTIVVIPCQPRGMEPQGLTAMAKMKDLDIADLGHLLDGL
jgi:hypothetical protein